MKSIFLALLIGIFFNIFSFGVFAGGDHGEGGGGDISNRVGHGKAVKAFDKEEGFKLSEKAIKNLGISFETIQGAGPWKISQEALVHIKQSSGVYRRYDGWISLVLVKIVRIEGGTIWIQSEDLEAGDEIAVKGANYLRMTDSDLNAGTVDSCSH